MSTKHQDDFKTIVSIGDSITAGGAATSREQCWVSRLGRLLAEFQETRPQVINNGIGANVLVDTGDAYEIASKPAGKQRYHRDVISHHPDLVTIAFGTNDMRGGTPIATFIDDLDVVIRSIQRECAAKIVVLSTYFIVDFGMETDPWGKANLQRFQECNREMEACAQKNSVMYADVFSAMEHAHWLVDKDKVHPNNLGHAVIANKVFEVIANHCRSLSRKAYNDSESYTPWRDESGLRM